MPIPKPIGCHGCELFGSGTGFSVLEGNGSSGLMVVAEALGQWEERDALPLRPYAPTGGLFQRVLDEQHIGRHTLTITNTIRCRPPGNYLRGAPYERAALDHCSPYLRAAIAERRPKALLALGDTALRELYDGEPPGTVTSLRGFILPSRYGCPMIAAYHPAYLVPRRSRDGEAGNPGAMHLFGVLTRDILLAHRTAREGAPTQLETTYALHPSASDVRVFVEYVRAHPVSPITYDIETPSIFGQPEPDDWRAKPIVQIQFSTSPGQAIVLPFEPFREAIAAILGTTCPKVSWNGRGADDLALEGQGITINGVRHDAMLGWQHLHPSFTSAKDDRDTDKGVPSRLMGLQSCTSFYVPEQPPWKHIAADPANVPYYGALDSDMNLRCWLGIERQLKAQGLWGGYLTHKVDLRPVLDGLGRRGLPVDAVKQAELRAYVITELDRLVQAIQTQLPTQLVRFHPPTGYRSITGQQMVNGVKVPLKQLVESYDPAAPPFCGPSGKRGVLVRATFPLSEKEIAISDNGGSAQRWAIQLPFNPSGSSGDTLRYIRHRGYRVPTQIDDPAKPTTGKLELKRLADETGDTVLRLITEHRELRKTGMDYSSGAWLPGADGRVHATFRWGTASGQLTAVNPPVQTYPEHSEIAKRAKAAIAAQTGHVLLKLDYRGAHSRMAGWLAGDADWYRLASSDVHSYVTAHFLHLQGADYLLEMADDELAEELDIIKKIHGYVRNYKVKRCVHGLTFGLRARKMHRMYPDAFPSQADAQQLIMLLQRLFPKTFVEFPAWVERQITSVTRCRLISPFGHHRQFLDFDLEQATAYLPSNCFHCYGQAALVRLHQAGMLEKYEAVNWTHDAVWLHPPVDLVDQCVVEVTAELERPSDVLASSPLGAFWCATDGEIGPALSSMRPLL